MIIHISGSPGCGKTTLGNVLKDKFKHIHVKDTDDFTHDLPLDDEKIWMNTLHTRIEKIH